MQTFLPYADFEKSAQCLDRARLGKQRVEVYQILRALKGESKGWINHPATLQYRGYEQFLARYGIAVCNEWIKRGYKDNLLGKFSAEFDIGWNFKVPSWFGNELYHSSHRSALLAKNYEWYKQFNWQDEPKIDYYWPVRGASK